MDLNKEERLLEKKKELLKSDTKELDRKWEEFKDEKI
jgi:hypothetical protein